MDKNEFLREAEDFIYKEVAKNANILLGKNKTAALSTGLFLKLPIEISVEKVDQPLPKLLKDLGTMMPRFSAFVKMEEHTKVHFVFMYNDEKDFKSILSNFQYRDVFFTFVYLHEVQHILRKHITTSYNSMMLRIAKDIQDPDAIINIAEDHAINYSIKDLFVLTKLSGYWPEIEAMTMYNHKYHTDKMSDIDILKDLISTAQIPKVTDMNGEYNSVNMGGKESVQPKGSKDIQGGDQGGKTGTAQDDADTAMSDLANAMQDMISSATKGTAAGNLMEAIFESVKVETGWFKKIKASFKRQVFYMTHDYYTSWSNLNNTYRKIYKSPKKIFLDTKINIILSVDHSGSMSTKDLQRLLYLVESESKKISKLTVLIHDTRIVKEFEIGSEYDIAESPTFKQALGVRYVSGGTSHECVFQRITEMKIKEPEKTIYLSFSDNYSDIEQTIGKYPAMNKLTKYWICAGANNPVKVAGTNIMMV